MGNRIQSRGVLLGLVARGGRRCMDLSTGRPVGSGIRGFMVLPTRSGPAPLIGLAIAGFLLLWLAGPGNPQDPPLRSRPRDFFWHRTNVDVPNEKFRLPVP